MLRYRSQGLAGIAAAVLGAAVIAQSGMPAEPRQIRANGVDLSYVEQGKGTPVVFVHGAVADLRFWEPQREAFSRRHRFIAYTYRYHGAAPWPDDGKQYSVETHAADLAAFISALKAGPVHLVGLSYGGVVAALVAANHPQLSRTLTLAEPGLFSLLAEVPEGKPVLDEWNKGAVPVMEAIKAGDNVRATRQLAALVTGRPPDQFDALPAQLRQVLLDNARTMPLLFSAPESAITCKMLRGIKAPTLVVTGELTPRIFSATNKEVGRCIGGSRQVVIPKASHPMSYENPAEFNRAVLGFIQQS